MKTIAINVWESETERKIIQVINPDSGDILTKLDLPGSTTHLTINNYQEGVLQVIEDDKIVATAKMSDLEDNMSVNKEINNNVGGTKREISSGLDEEVNQEGVNLGM